MMNKILDRTDFNSPLLSRTGSKVGGQAVIPHFYIILWMKKIFFDAVVS